MDIGNIIQEIDAQIAQLSQARDLLSGSITKRKPGPASSAATSFNPEEFDKRPRKRRTMSSETRDKMAKAQRLRWANAKKAAKKAASEVDSTTTQRVVKRASKKKPRVARKTAGARDVVPKSVPSDSTAN
jgi:hypothetical protein